MSLYVTLANGDILFHKKNEIPPNWKSENYFQDDLDKWLYHPNFVECPARRRVNKITKCKKLYSNWTCDLKKTNELDQYGETITAAICNTCEINPLLHIEGLCICGHLKSKHHLLPMLVPARWPCDLCDCSNYKEANDTNQT